ncbi:MAG: lytic transglycosylase domain-containing protein [Bryobacterales bacterium]|nr:lytic transglycosylase domain-containing protein [Bryobacterales bacterium]
MIRPSPCLRVAGLAATFLIVAPGAAGAVPAKLSELSRALRASRSDANFRALQSFAESASGRDRALAHYAIGMAHYRDKDYPAAESALARVGATDDWAAEYAAYYRARCIVLAEEFERALAPLSDFAKRFPSSLFRPAAGRLRVESLLRLKRLDEARALLAAGSSALEEPVRLYLSGRAEHLDGQLERAVSLYREAYYFYPFSDQARAAEEQLNRLRAAMGDGYPKAPAKWRLARAESLRKGREYTRAAAEYGRALSAGLTGDERDRAVIGRGAADYSRRRSSAAYTSLARARPREPELEAQRLYLLCAIERRKRIVGEMLSSISKLAAKHGKSPWYEEALLSVGNYYYLLDDRPSYSKWFRRLAEAFPQGKHAAYAHWKLCWRAWLDDTPDRAELLNEHIQRYGGASTGAGAIYWLGRLHEDRGRRAEAAAHFNAVMGGFPHYYYAFLSEERLRRMGNVTADAQTERRILAGLPKVRSLASQPLAATQELLQRAGDLHQLGFDDDARTEYSRVDYRKPDGHFAGLHLGRMHEGRDEHHLALRAMKRYVFGYLRMPYDSLDIEYWRLLFPIGWEDRLRSRSERHGLDPYLVAALIRQESEFHAGARSRAGALGLMQIMPGTGRGLFRRLGISGFANRKLTVPDISLRLGTFHLKEVLAQFGGELEKTLAGYNAGERRIGQWMALGPFEDSEEFAETIPFSETRGYVQSVLRNRAMYERVYGD